MATLDDLQTSGSLQGTDKILYRQSGTDYAATLDTLRKFAIMQLVDGSVRPAFGGRWRRTTAHLDLPGSLHQ